MRSPNGYWPVSAALMAAFVLALFVTPVFQGPHGARAAEITIDTGNFWFCDSSFQDGVCDTTIQVGDTVTWNWVEGNHTTTECGADCDNPTATPLWDAPLNSSNTTFSRTFDTPGTYLYLCSFHPILMRGRIIVEEVPPTPTPTPETPAPVETPAPPPPVEETVAPAPPVVAPSPPIEETPAPAPPVVETPEPVGPPRTPPVPIAPAPGTPEVIIAPPPGTPIAMEAPPTGAGSASGGEWPWWPLAVAAGAAVGAAGVLLAHQGWRAKPQ